MESHSSEVMVLAGTAILICIGVTALNYSLNKCRSNLNEIKTSDLPLTESTQSKVDSLIEGTKYDPLHSKQSPEYNGQETGVTIIEELDHTTSKLNDMTHQFNLLRDMPPHL